MGAGRAWQGVLVAGGRGADTAAAAPISSSSRQAGKQHLDLVGGLKAVQLVKQLEHSALHLAVTATTAPRAVCAG